MGGYGALRMARAFRFAQVLLVAPQFTPFPQKNPYDQRFFEATADLDPQFDTLDIDPKQGLNGVIVFDPNVPGDRLQTRCICATFPRLKTVAMPFVGHPTLNVISEQEQFGRIQDELLARNISHRRLRKLHKHLRRGSKIYRENLDAYLEARKLRA